MVLEADLGLWAAPSQLGLRTAENALDRSFSSPKDTDSTAGAPPSCPFLHLITYQRPPAPHWGCWRDMFRPCHPPTALLKASL